MRTTERQAGFTLIEIIIVLAMIAIMASAIGPTVISNMNEARMSRAVREVSAVEQGMASWVQRTGAVSYAAVSMAALTGAGALPAAFSSATANPWGGGYDVTGTATSFTVTVHAVPSAKERDALNGAFGARATVSTPASYPGDVTIQFNS